MRINASQVIITNNVPSLDARRLKLCITEKRSPQRDSALTINSGAFATEEDGKMNDLEREIEATIYDFKLNGMTPKRTAKRIMALITEKAPVATSPAGMAGSAPRLLVEKKLRLLKERYSKACDGNDHEEGVKLYAQICLLDNMWLDIIRIEGE